MATCYRHPDRETGLSCSECSRPICTDCVTFAAVGLRCPEHAGVAARSTPKPVRSVQRTAARQGIRLSGDAIVTKVLVAANLIVYLITVAQGAGLNEPGGDLFFDWALFGPAVEQGDWWRLITAAFLHGSIAHIAFNMLALWWLGGPVELALGRWRFFLLYVSSGLAGSAGALLIDPRVVTVGASGAIFGMLGAGLILEWRATGRLAGNYTALIAINLMIGLVIPGISMGGHVGGLLGGIAGTAVIVLRGTFRHGFDLLTALGITAVGVLSVALAFWRVSGLT